MRGSWRGASKNWWFRECGLRRVSSPTSPGPLEQYNRSSGAWCGSAPTGQNANTIVDLSRSGHFRTADRHESLEWDFVIAFPGHWRGGAECTNLLGQTCRRPNIAKYSKAPYNENALYWNRCSVGLLAEPLYPLVLLYTTQIADNSWLALG